MRLIDKDELLERIDTGMNLIEVMQAIIDSKETERRGHWKTLTPVPQTSSLYMAECSECGKLTYVGNYCMECGARNEGNDE